MSKGDWVIDVGANVGHYTKRLSDLVGPAGRVIAIEPVPDTFALLAANVSLCRHANVTLLNLAVSNRTAVVGIQIPDFDSGLKNYYQASVSSERSELMVMVITLDSLPLGHGIGLIKIDAERHDPMVLEGAEALLRRDHPTLIVETAPEASVEWLTRLGVLCRNAPGLSKHAVPLRPTYDMMPRACAAGQRLLFEPGTAFHGQCVSTGTGVLMRILGFSAWRPLFILSAVLILIGGPQHPQGTMEQMLAHPQWVPSHLFLLGGFVAMLVALVLFQRDSLPDRTRRWARLAAIGAALESGEMAFHTAASVDHASLMAGHATPILTTHLWFSVVVYPVFGVMMIGLIITGMRDRVLGSPWIAWLGILGAAAHGLAAPLVVALDVPYARILFPFLMFLALWMVLAAAWPARAAAGRSLDRASVAT